MSQLDRVAESVPSLEFLLKHGEAISPGTPIVFCGIDRRELAGRNLPSNMTGVLVKRAYAALYTAKHGGRNRVGVAPD